MDGKEPEEVMAKKKILMAVAAFAVLMIALWGGAWGWSLIGKKDTAYAMAMIYTQIVMIGVAALLVAKGGAE